jgi:hypothetical protein
MIYKANVFIARKIRVKAKAMESVASPFGLRSGVTPQRAGALAGDPVFGRAEGPFGVAFYGTAEQAAEK